MLAAPPMARAATKHHERHNSRRSAIPIYNLLPTEIEGFDSLAELALDMRWSWNHATDEVWRQLDPDAVGDHA